MTQAPAAIATAKFETTSRVVKDKEKQEQERLSGQPICPIGGARGTIRERMPNCEWSKSGAIRNRV